MANTKFFCDITHCSNKRVNHVYSYCMSHMSYQKPIKDIEKPDDCPICFESETPGCKYLHLTCGHWIHENCIIYSGRVGCPMCRQFIYLEKKTFLQVRIVNLNRKLEKLQIIYDFETINRLKNTLETTKMFVLSIKPDGDFEFIDKYVQLLNKEIYSMLT